MGKRKEPGIRISLGNEEATQALERFLGKQEMTIEISEDLAYKICEAVANYYKKPVDDITFSTKGTVNTETGPVINFKCNIIMIPG